MECHGKTATLNIKYVWFFEKNTGDVTMQGIMQKNLNPEKKYNSLEQCECMLQCSGTDQETTIRVVATTINPDTSNTNAR